MEYCADVRSVRSSQGDGVLGADEGGCEVLDGVGGEAPGAEGGDVLDDMGLAEAGPAGTEPCFGFDEGVDDVVPFQPAAARWRGAAADLGFEGMAGRYPDGVRFGLPPMAEHLGGQGPVLAGPGGEGGRVVGPHPLFRGGMLGAGAGEVLLDGLRPLRERPQPSPVEPDHLPASVAVRPPLHRQPLGEAAAEFLLVDRARPPAPTRRAAWHRGRCRSRPDGDPGWPPRNACAAADPPPGSCGARTWPSPRRWGSAGGRRRSAGGSLPPAARGGRGRRPPPPRERSTPPPPPLGRRTPTATTPTSGPRR